MVFDIVTIFPRMIDAVTVDVVLRVAREHIDPESMTLVVVGPKGRE